MTGTIVRRTGIAVRAAVFPPHLAAPIPISDVYTSGNLENVKLN